MLAVRETPSPALSIVRSSGNLLDAASVEAISAICRQSLDGRTRAILIDLAAPEAVTQTGLAMMLHLYSENGNRARIVFCNAGRAVRAALAEHGLDRALPFCDTVAAATAEPEIRRLMLVGLRVVVLCAGAGTRMRPLTEATPKPMLDIAGAPILARILAHLESFGLNDVILNLGHHGPQIPAWFAAAGPSPQSRFFLAEGRDTLAGWQAEPLGSLSTLGRLARDHFAFSDDTFVLRGDALIDIDLADMLAIHRRTGADVTIAAQQVDPDLVSRYEIIVTDEGGRITAFQEKPGRAEALSCQANTGIYLFRPGVLTALDARPGRDIAGDLFPELLRRGAHIQAYRAPFRWIDVGCARDYYQAVARVLEGGLPGARPTGQLVGASVWSAPGASVSPQAEIEGPCHIGAGAVVAAGARLVGPCAIGPGAVVEGRTLVRDSIICAGTRVTTGTWVDQMIASPDWAFVHHYADGMARPLRPLEGLCAASAAPAESLASTDRWAVSS
jgi:NDP-sugar pyrophosphorylase family protein